MQLGVQLCRRLALLGSAVGLVLGAGFAGAPASSAAGPITMSFAFTGSIETVVVPDGVNQVTVDIWGAQGGDGGTCADCGTPGAGGLGAHVHGTSAVTPGASFMVVVGSRGGD